MLAMLANLKDADRGALNEKIEQVLAQVNLSDRADSKVKTLSGGMVRRLGIAQALLGDPEILIFDEPTAGLDPEERLRFKNMLAQLRGERIILISTHIVEDVEAVCDCVAIMKEGRIAVSGTCAQIAERAQGKVYSLPESETARLTGDYTIQKHYDRDGVSMIKILSREEQPFEHTPANVEDGYICVLEDI